MEVLIFQEMISLMNDDEVPNALAWYKESKIQIIDEYAI